MKAETDRFIALLDDLEQRGRLPDAAGISSRDRAALHVAQRLFDERVQVAPPVLPGCSAEDIRGQAGSLAKPSVIAFPAFSAAGIKGPEFPRWLSGGIAAAAVAGMLLLARGLATNPYPADPSRLPTPSDMGVTGPESLPPKETQQLHEGQGQAPTATGERRAATSTSVPKGLATPRLREGASQSPSPIAAATGIPALAEPLDKDKPAGTAGRARQASPAATETAETTPRPIHTATQPAVSTLLPTQDPRPPTPTAPAQPPPIQTMEPWPTDPPRTPPKP